MSYEQTNDDLLYIEDGYLTPDGYYVYIALGQVAIGPYIDEGYIDAFYYEDYSSVGTLVCAAEIVTGVTVEASGTWSSEFTNTVTATRIQQLASDQVMIAEQSAVVYRIQQLASTQTAEFTQTTAAGRIIELAAAFTDAFTPTLTADVFKNHTAVIESQFDMNTQAVVDRSANVLLEHIANLNAQAAKTVVIESDLTSTATQTSAPTKTSATDSTLTTTTDLTATALNVQFGQSTISDRSNLFTSRYFGLGRPQNLIPQNPSDPKITYNTSIKKFGTASVYPLEGRSTHSASDTYIIKPRHSDIFAFECWFYNPSTTYTANGGFGIGSNRSNPIFWIDFLIAESGYIRVTHGTTNAATTDVSYPLQQWNHLLFLADQASSGSTGFQTSLYINGTRVLQWVRRTSLEVSSIRDVFQWGFNSSQTQILYDHLSLHKGTHLGYDWTSSSITVPTTPRTNDINTTVFLWPVDGNGLDDIFLTQLTSAALTSTTAISVQANPSIKQAESTITASVAITALISRNQTFTADLTATVTQTTDQDKLSGAASQINLESTVSAIIGLLISPDITVSSLFTPSVTVQAQLAGVALLETTALVTVTAEKTTDISSTVSVESSLSAQAVKTTEITAAASTDTALSLTGSRQRSTAAALANEASLSVIADKIREHTAIMTSVATVSVSALKLKITGSDLSAAFTVPDAKAHVKHNGIASLEQSVATVAITGTRIRFMVATITATATTSVTAVKTATVISATVATATATVTAVKTADVSIQALSLFTPTFTAQAQLAGLALLETQSAVLALVGVIKQYPKAKNTGVSSYSNEKYARLGPLSGLPFGGLRFNALGFTASFWVRRRSVGGYQTLLHPGTIPPAAASLYALIYDNNNIRLRNNFDPDEPGATWNSAAPMDANWHHILLLAYKTAVGDPDGSAIEWQLWVDGVYKGQRDHFASWTGGFSNDQYVNLGGPGLIPNQFDQSWNEPPTPTNNNSELDFAQIWIGISPSQRIQPQGPSTAYGQARVNVSDYYDGGYQDLGLSGQGSLGQLPVPKIYATLDKPWSTVSFQGSYTTEEKTGLPFDRPDQQAVAVMLQTANAVVVSTGQFVSVSTVTVTAVKNTDSVITLAADSQVSSQADVSIGIVSDLSATVDLTATVFKIKQFTATITAEVQLSAQAGRQEQTEADLSAASTVTATALVIEPIRATADLSVTATVTADVQSFTDSITLMVSFGELIAAVTVIPPTRAEATVTAEFQLTVTIGAIEQFAAITTSFGTLEIQPVITASARSDLSATVTAAAVAVKFTGIIETFTAFNTVLTLGDVINIDPFLTLIIEPESRGLRILQETREITIDSETRVNTIKD